MVDFVDLEDDTSLLLEVADEYLLELATIPAINLVPAAVNTAQRVGNPAFVGATVNHIEDNFNRANNSDLGNQWLRRSGSAFFVEGVEAGIVANEAHMTATAPVHATDRQLREEVLASADQALSLRVDEIVLAGTGATFSLEAGVEFRASDDHYGGYACSLIRNDAFGDGWWFILTSRSESGVVTGLGTDLAVPADVVLPAVITVKIVGNNIVADCVHAGTAVFHLEATSSLWPNVGRVGIIETVQLPSGRTGSVSADDFVAQIVDLPLVVQGLASASAVESPSLTQVHNLAVDNVSTGQVTDAPALVQTHLLEVGGVSTAGTVENVTLGVGGIDLTVDSVATAGVVESPTLTQVHNLVVQGTTTQQSLDAPVLTQVHFLAVDGVSTASAVDALSLSQVHVLAVAAMASASAVDQVTLSSEIALTVSSAMSAGNIGSPSLSQVHVLVVQAVDTASSTDSPLLSQLHFLVVDGLLTGSLLEDAVVGGAPVLPVLWAPGVHNRVLTIVGQGQTLTIVGMHSRILRGVGEH